MHWEALLSQVSLAVLPHILAGAWRTPLSHWWMCQGIPCLGLNGEALDKHLLQLPTKNSTLRPHKTDKTSVWSTNQSNVFGFSFSTTSQNFCSLHTVSLIHCFGSYRELEACQSWSCSKLFHLVLTRVQFLSWSSVPCPGVLRLLLS